MGQKVLCVCLLTMLGFASALSLGAEKSSILKTLPTSNVNDKEAAFQGAMRKLWEDHITWTRVFIVSATADLPASEGTHHHRRGSGCCCQSRQQS